MVTIWLQSDYRTLRTGLQLEFQRLSMKEQEKDLAAFEEYLFSFMNDATESKPLTTDEVVAILQSYGPPEAISSEEQEQFVGLMKEAHNRRMKIARRNWSKYVGI